MASEPYFSKDEVPSSQFSHLEGYYFFILVDSEFQGTRVGYLSCSRASSIDNNQIF